MLLTVHDYGSYHGGFHIVNEWWTARGKGTFPEVLTSPVGVIVEADGQPMAALWLYLTIGHGIAYLEFPVTKPGGGLRAVHALRKAVEALTGVAKSHNYGILRVATLPKIARALIREGWQQEDEEPRIPLMLKL